MAVSDNTANPWANQRTDGAYDPCRAEDQHMSLRASAGTARLSVEDNRDGRNAGGDMLCYTPERGDSRGGE